jgi:hypothetical protein
MALCGRYTLHKDCRLLGDHLAFVLPHRERHGEIMEQGCKRQLCVYLYVAARIIIVYKPIYCNTVSRNIPNTLGTAVELVQTNIYPENDTPVSL